MGASNGTMRALKAVGVGIGVVALLLTLGGMVWSMSAGLAGKADKEALHEIDDRVHEIDKEVTTIKTELRMYIRAQRPDLPIGKE